MSDDPFDALAQVDDPIAPRPEFAAALRAQLIAELDIDTVAITPRSTTMTTPATSATMKASTPVRTIAVPYLAVDDGVAALAYYGEAFGAVEAMRVVGDDGRVGHAEFTIGGVPFYLADEYPEYGVISPRTAGATTVTMHLTVADVDATYSRAVAAGAQSLSEPADQPHGARHGTLMDPFGHRWMLSQPIETVDTAEYARRMTGSAFTVTDSDPGAASAPGAVSGSTVDGNGRIWAAVNATDAPAMIRFMVDVLGFTEQLVVPGADPGVIEHSQLHWPDGGVVQVASANRPDNPFSEKPVGVQSLYLITDAPTAVYERCVAAAVSVLMPPTSPDYDPTGMVFTVEDHEGNLWSVGTYAGEA